MLIREINDKLIKINNFVIIYLFVININDINKIITIVVFVKIYLINNLKINMFINVNIFKSQRIIVNFNHNILIIKNCEVKIVIDSINCVKLYFKRIIRNQKIFTILFNELIKILITFYNDLLIDNFFFWIAMFKIFKSK